MVSGVRARAAVRRAGRLLGNVAGSPSIAPSNGTSRPLWQDVNEPSFPEIDCVRDRLSSAIIDAAEQRATRLGTGADRVLISTGAIEEEDYLEALGDSIGVSFEPLDGIARRECPLDNDRLIDSAQKGLLSLSIDGVAVIVIAPRDLMARKILALINDAPNTAARFRFTTVERLHRFVLRCAGERLATIASDALTEKWPKLSAAAPYRWSTIITLAATMAGLAAAAFFAPRETVHGVELILAVFFIAWLALRITGAWIRLPPPASIPGQPDSELPVYSVICALYQEAPSVEGLLSAIERLDYPHEKLDVLIAVEADDNDTLAAIAARRHRVPLTVITVPAMGPRTKPKALNVALPFARGFYTVVYDAEDRPQPDQLRRALHAFSQGIIDLACVQARLCIDNTDDSWLARYFTAEYAGQFDVFLPGLTAMQLPLPLGGSSNHFRTKILRDVGAWDAHNVTEDADLGVRLARFGYRADIIDSTTYEEAPARPGPWLRQRTRWFKGWMQTWRVHMRQPVTLLRELGVPGFLAFQLMVGGNVLSALVHPVFMAWLTYTLSAGDGLLHGGTTTAAVLGALYGATAVIGYSGSAFIGLLGLQRRGLSSTAWALLLTPLYWLMLSLAAWRALFQLFFAPYAWEKTTHGLARTSHRAATMTHAMIAFNRDIGGLKARGELAEIGEPPPRRFWRFRTG